MDQIMINSKWRHSLQGVRAMHQAEIGLTITLLSQRVGPKLIMRRVKIETKNSKRLKTHESENSSTSLAKTNTACSKTTKSSLSTNSTKSWMVLLQKPSVIMSLREVSRQSAAVTWLEYCRYGVKPNTLNQSRQRGYLNKNKNLRCQVTKIEAKNSRFVLRKKLRS